MKALYWFVCCGGCSRHGWLIFLALIVVVYILAGSAAVMRHADGAAQNPGSANFASTLTDTLSQKMRSS
jgi:hypothetical protein